MNKVIQLGRMTKDPELSYVAGTGTAVTKFSIAVPRVRKKGETDFHNCVAFGKTAENISTYFKKGQRILIEGELHSDSYEAKDGTRKYVTDILVDRFDFIESSEKSNNIEEVIPTDFNDTPFI